MIQQHSKGAQQIDLHAQVFNESGARGVFDCDVGKLRDDDGRQLQLRSGSRPKRCAFGQSGIARGLAFQQKRAVLDTCFRIRGFIEELCDTIAVTYSFAQSSNIIKAV
jgi:hypothetical protein